MVLFSALFATYAAWSTRPMAVRSSNQLFDRDIVAVETVALLISSFVCGLAMIAAKRANMLWTQVWLLLTGLLGLVFLVIELSEFARMIARAPGRSAAPSCRPSSRWSAATACTSPPACCGSER